MIVASSSLKVAIVLGCFGAFLYLLNALLPRDLDQAAPGRPPRSKLPQRKHACCTLRIAAPLPGVAAVAAEK